MPPPQRRRALILAALGGVVFALTSPPTDLYPAVVVGLALLAASIADAPSFARAFGRGAVWGTAAGVVGLRFVPAVIQRFTDLGGPASYVALVLLAAAQSLSWALGAGLANLLQRRLRVPFEIAFGSGVFVTLLLPAIFAWTPAGLVSPWPALVQLADVVGERGVSVIFAVAAALLARAALAATGRTPAGDPLPVSARRASALRHAGAALGIFAALGAYGVVRMRGIAGASEALPTARIALVNQAIGPLERWDPKNHAPILASLRDLTRKAEADGVELTVWPEAAYPYTLGHDERRAPQGTRAMLGGGVRGPVLAGLITRAAPVQIEPGVVEYNSYNSATLVTPDGAMQAPYDKLELLWFGETVPGGAYLPWLRRMFQKSGGLVPGTAPRGLTLERDHGPALRMAVLNCYEDTLAGVGRRVTTAITPNLLVNVTNDAWFVGTAEPELHARLATMRAIEMRRDLVRSVNLGVTSWVDAAGVVRARAETTEPSFTIVTPAIREDGLTLYARAGDLPVVAMLWLLSVLGARSRRRDDRRDAVG